jgi:hypothetical protein
MKARATCNAARYRDIVDVVTRWSDESSRICYQTYVRLIQTPGFIRRGCDGGRNAYVRQDSEAVWRARSKTVTAVTVLS